MSADAPTVAVVDDDDDLRRATVQLLTLAGYATQGFADPRAVPGAIGADYPGIVVSDVRMPHVSGIELFRTLHARDPELPVILVTGHGDIAMAVDALKAGAWDFLSKPFDPDALVAAVARATKARALALENRRLRRTAEAEASDELVGDSAVVRRLRALIPVLADADLDLVIEGETGTGKELFARLIHRAGKRGRHRFTTIDCATVPPEIVERELFARNGIVARANRGTLFLDQLDRASDELHHRLARLAETRAVALEARDPDPVDVRIIATIPDGGRERVPAALYHRLAGVPLRMPPLAERREDVPLLLAHLTARAAATLRRPLPPLGDTVHALARRDWPGNVRELERFAERLCLGIESLGHADPAAPPPPLPDRLDAFERVAIEDAVTAAGGDMAAAIAALGIPRKTFYYRVKRLSIDLKRLRGVR